MRRKYYFYHSFTDVSVILHFVFSVTVASLCLPHSSLSIFLFLSCTYSICYRSPYSLYPSNSFKSLLLHSIFVCFGYSVSFCDSSDRFDSYFVERATSPWLVKVLFYRMALRFFTRSVVFSLLYSSHCLILHWKEQFHSTLNANVNLIIPVSSFLFLIFFIIHSPFLPFLYAFVCLY